MNQILLTEGKQGCSSKDRSSKLFHIRLGLPDLESRFGEHAGKTYICDDDKEHMGKHGVGRLSPSARLAGVRERERERVQAPRSSTCAPSCSQCWW